MKTFYAVRVYNDNTIRNATEGHSRVYWSDELEEHFYDHSWSQWMDEQFLFEDEESARAKFNEECEKAISMYSETLDSVIFDFVELLSAKAENIGNFANGISDEETIEDCYCESTGN